MFLLPSMLVLLSIVINSELVDARYQPTVKKSIESQNGTITIEVLCFIDFDTYSLHAGEKTGREADAEIENYFLPFWKNVDHYLSLLNIRISLKGIIIAHTREEENVFLNSQKNRLQMDAFDSPATLLYLGKYIHSNKNLPTHHVAIVITQSVSCKGKEKLKKSLYKNKNLCQNANDVATNSTGMCPVSVNDRSTSTSVAIIRDKNKMYTGVRNVVFAIGQLLRIPNDGSEEAKECKSEDGYFMSGNINFSLPYKFKWSNCSIQNLKKIRTEPMWACLFKKINGKEIGFSKAPFPGEILSLDDYCKKLTNYKACSYDDVCTSLTCSYGEYCGRVIKGPAIEGSWCGSSDTSTMRCLYGKCVPFSFDKFEEVNTLKSMYQFYKAVSNQRVMAK